MEDKRLDSANKTYTPASRTTVSIDYSADKKILEVEFIGAKVYHYLKVEPAIWSLYTEIIISGGSSGVFVNQQIKPVYAFRGIH
ncbi:KTSC domain-containing protein [Pedobacter sp. P351]|uniref:KTSC domain-containing protein n=1 Tax=Pedobacter superstes TaxID=3133441 RepID=UPI003096D275